MGPLTEASQQLPLAGLSALAELLPDRRKGRSPLQLALAQATDQFTDADTAAVRDFEVVGRKCLQQLSPEALAALADANTASAGSKAAPEDPSSLSSSEQDQILMLLRKHDRDQDGFLTREEFKEVFDQLGDTQHLSDDAADSIMDMLLQENQAGPGGTLKVTAFMAWLGGELSDGVDKTSSEEKASARDALQSEFQALTEELQALRGKVVDNTKELDKARSQLVDNTKELDKARSQLEEAQDGRILAEKRLAKQLREVDKREREIEEMEKHHEQELEAAQEFWRSIAKSSARCTLGQLVDLEKAKWLGNGKYGYVLRTSRLEDGRDVVVKLLSVRWAHLALKEWHCSHVLAGQPNTVAFEEPLLHADDDKAIDTLLKAGFESGELTSKTKRTSFPDRWICLVEEFMNRGSVQDWMDKGLLTLGGTLVVLQSVASALAHMHSCGLTHNDIKPENILLLQDEKQGPHAPVVVKLADLGLAKMSTDRTQDVSQLGMTVVCMATGERFGTRKYQPELISTFVSDVTRIIRDVVAAAGDDNGRFQGLQKPLAELPVLLQKIFKREVAMQDVRDWPSLQSAGFFDTLEPGSARCMEKASVKRSLSKVIAEEQSTDKQTVENAGSEGGEG